MPKSQIETLIAANTKKRLTEIIHKREINIEKMRIIIAKLWAMNHRIVKQKSEHKQAK